MEMVLCVFGFLLNLLIFMCVRKNSHHENFMQMLGVGITLVASIYVIFDQVAFWMTGKSSLALVGIFMLVVASISVFCGAFYRIRFQKYYAGRQELALGILAMVLLGGLVVYKKWYGSAMAFVNGMLWIASGMLFMSLMMDKIKKNRVRVIGFIMTLALMFGHPLANLICGNTALAVAMNWVLIDLIMISWRRDRRMPAIICNGIMLLEAVFFAIGYPAGLCIFFLMVLPLLLLEYRDGIRTQKRKAAIRMVAGVLVTVMTTVVNVVLTYGSFENYYTYYYEMKRAVFINRWSDIGFMLFPILLYVYYRIDRKKHLEQLYWPVAGLVGYVGTIWASAWFHHNSYDGFNQLYLIWILFMYVGVKGLLDTFEEFRSFLTAYVCTFIGVFVLMLSGVEQTLQDANVWYCVDVKADAYLKVYDWNWKALKDNSIPPLMQELIDKCDGLRAGAPDMVIPCILTDNEYRIENFYRQTGQQDKFRYMYMLQKDLVESEREQQRVWEEKIFDRYKDIPYVMVERNCELYWYGIGIYSQLEPVYENEYGFIYKFPKG